MQIANLSAANDLLQQYVPAVKEVLGTDMTLERMVPLMAALGNPERKLRVVHVAGTSGKTSTAYYIASLLNATGKKAGLTVSPHIDSVTERIQIDGAPLDDAEFCQALGEYMDIIAAVAPQPTYFELLIGFVYWYFNKIGMDYAVIETGLGGLQDGSNVAHRADKVCVITDIGLDHVNVLGDTVQKISVQKAGIIHPGNVVYKYRQANVDAVFEATCHEKGAVLHLLDEAEQRQLPDVPNTLNDLPIFQQHNWLLAHAVYQALVERDGLHDLSADALRKTLETYIPGRMETRHVGGKTVIMDGAHNSQKMAALIMSFKQKYPNSKPAVLMSVKDSKDFITVVDYLLPVASRFILTRFKTVQDRVNVSAKLETIAEYCLKKGFENVTVEPDLKTAYEVLLNDPADVLLITGSFYLISNLRALALQ